MSRVPTLPPATRKVLDLQNSIRQLQAEVQRFRKGEFPWADTNTAMLIAASDKLGEVDRLVGAAITPSRMFP